MIPSGQGHPKRPGTILWPLLGLLFACLPSSRLHSQPHHYEPVAGRIVGIWPSDWSAEYLSLLRQEYGFRGILIPPEEWYYQVALGAGFQPASMMATLPNESYQEFVSSHPAAYYYVDEPAEHDCYGHPSGFLLLSPEEIAARTHYIHYYRPGSRFVISGYKRCSHNLLAATNADMFMFSSYHHWSSTGLPVCHVNMGYADEWEPPWISGSDDQRADWTDFRNELGARFAMSWVHGGGDEYDQLFGHATNLGLEAVWVYSGETAPGPARLEEICAAAANHGWLLRIETPPLPVELSGFSAVELGHRRVRLEWKTLSETNVYGFMVERMIGSGRGFEELDGSFVPGHGTSIEPHFYAFVDVNAAPGRSYYRLRVKNLDGTQELSEHVAIDVLGGVARSDDIREPVLLESYPNPFNPATTIRYQLSEPEHVRIAVFNLLGQQLATVVEGPAPAGLHEVTWNAGALPSGVYLCRLHAGGEMVEVRLMLLR